MKRILLITLFTLTIALYTNSQNKNKELSIGLKNNQYGVADYKSNNWKIGLKHSIFTENGRRQYFQFNGGYSLFLKHSLLLSATAYGGSTYTGDYYNADINFFGEFYIFNKKAALYMELQPHYDSTFEYTTCYGLGAKYKITKEVALKLGYENIPEFRVPEKRLKTGIIFQSKSLIVEPEISFPVEKNEQTRVLCSFRYNIRL